MGWSSKYYSHTIPIGIPKDMGIVWEAYQYHKQSFPKNPYPSPE